MCHVGVVRILPLPRDTKHRVFACSENFRTFEIEFNETMSCQRQLASLFRNRQTGLIHVIVRPRTQPRNFRNLSDESFIRLPPRPRGVTILEHRGCLQGECEQSFDWKAPESRHFRCTHCIDLERATTCHQRLAKYHMEKSTTSTNP